MKAESRIHRIFKELVSKPPPIPSPSRLSPAPYPNKFPFTNQCQELYGRIMKISLEILTSSSSSCVIILNPMQSESHDKQEHNTSSTASNHQSRGAVQFITDSSVCPRVSSRLLGPDLWASRQQHGRQGISVFIRFLLR